MGREVRIFFATDIHGSDRCFRKFINAGKFYQADVLIMGGDVTGKMLVPIVAETGGRFVAEVFGVVRRFDETELPAIEKLIGDAGYYPYRTTPDEVDELRADEGRVDATFRSVMSTTVTRWLELAETRLDGTDIVCLVSPGNDDQPFIDTLLASSPRVINPDGRAIELPGGFELVSLGYANRTPWHSPRELDEADLEQRLRTLAGQAGHPERMIFNLHVPPKDSGLDQAVLLNADLSPALRNGSPVIGGVGSTAVRNVTESVQPLLALHGHIHESRGKVRIGRTTAINPGSEYSDGVLRGVLVNLEVGKGIRGTQFVTG
jgi:Icc-related predicted phosphoesterase